MKRAELVVGQAYWYSRSNSRWEEHLNEGSKVVVVDTGCWEQRRDTWTRDTNPRKTTGGTGVLVDLTSKIYYSGEEKVRREVVSVTAIRGLYEETRAIIQAREDARRTRAITEQERHDKERAESDVAIELAKEYGVRTHRSPVGGTNIVISAADLTELIEKAKLGKLYEASIPW